MSPFLSVILFRSSYLLISLINSLAKLKYSLARVELVLISIRYLSNEVKKRCPSFCKSKLIDSVPNFFSFSSMYYNNTLIILLIAVSFNGISTLSVGVNIFFKKSLAANGFLNYSFRNVNSAWPTFTAN